jgi:hypothetical protein
VPDGRRAINHNPSDNAHDDSVPVEDLTHDPADAHHNDGAERDLHDDPAERDLDHLFGDLLDHVELQLQHHDLSQES